MRKIFYLSLVGAFLQKTIANTVVQDKSLNKGIGINNFYRGEGNRWTGDGNLMLGKFNAVDGFHNQVNGGTNVIRGKVNMVNGEKNMIEGEQNTVNGENNLVIGSGNVVSNDLSFIDFDNELNKRLISTGTNSFSFRQFNTPKIQYISQIKQTPLKQVIYTNPQPYTPISYKPITTSYSAITTTILPKSPSIISPIVVPSRPIEKPINPKPIIPQGSDLRSQIQKQIQARLKQAFSRAGIHRY